MNIHVVKLKNTPIFEQLKLEEALLRADKRNWCLINRGSPPAIVMGISGNPEHHIDEIHYQKNPVPVIKRFSGGGTVFVDHNTIFVTFICNGEELKIPSYPKNIMQWTGEIYRPVFEKLDFQITENDYTFSNRKFGGNAQCIQKQRWLHHSTLLWDYCPKSMLSLKMPSKMPSYRTQRTHDDFLCRIKDYLPDAETLERKLLNSLAAHFTIHEKTLEEVEGILQLPHRKATILSR